GNSSDWIGFGDNTDAATDFRVHATSCPAATTSSTPLVAGASCSTCYRLVLARNNPSGGSVPIASPPNSAGCASGQYNAGQRIQVTAVPGAGWKVGNWVGT